MSRKASHIAWAAVLAAWVLASSASSLRAVDVGVRELPKVSEANMIETLKNGSKPDKAITCKQLAVYGTPNAVPALAPLLLDPELASWARIALESIPGEAPCQALRDAMTKVQGRLLIGVINSLAFRHDAKAVEAIAGKLKDADAEVVAAAGAALGKIGGDQAAAILAPALASPTPALRAAAGEGTVLCAEGYLNAGKNDLAMKLYDAVRKADVPKQRILEATRGAILARKTAGIGLLVEQLRSGDKAFYAIGLRVARELPGKEVQQMLVDELGKAASERQAQLILVLADRREAGALSLVLQAAKAGPKNVRLVAIEALQNLGDATCVPALLEAAADADEELSQAAMTTLARLSGQEVEAELLNRLKQSNGKALLVLIELTAQRKIDGSFPIILKAVEDNDAGVRAAAIDAVAAVGDVKQTDLLVQLVLKAKSKEERDGIAKSMQTLVGRCGAACVPALMPLAKSDDPAQRTICLAALVVAGGPDALAGVKSLLDDKEEAVRDEAVRSLSTWSNRWPEDASVTAPLLAIAQSPKKPLYKVLALRGYLGYLQGSKKLSNADKLAKINEVLPLLSRAEEKNLAISVLGTMGGGAFDLLVKFAADPSVCESACVAIVSSKHLANLGKEKKKKALQAVVDNSKVDSTKKKAQELLKAVG